VSNRGNFEQVGVEAVVKGFDAYVKQMKELVGQTQKAGQQIGAASGDADKLGKSLDISAGSILKFGAAIAGAQLGVAAIRGAFSNTIGAAIDFESSFAGVRKTVDATEEEFAQLAQGFRDLSKTIPVNVNELNRIGEAAGQLGIKKEDILGFTETVAKLSATTTLTSDQAATDLARLANVVGFTADEFDNVASVIVALGNAGASTEPEILAFAERIAGAGKIAGLTIDEILGIGEAMSSVGIEAEAGGTAVQKILLQITEAVATGNDDLAIFAATAGLTAEQFAEAWGQDAGQAFTAFVEGLGKSGTQAFQILDELDLKDQRLIRSFLSLSGAGDLLRNSLDNASNAMKSTSAIDTEFAKRQETTAAQLQILQNRIGDVGISVGQVLLPAINDAIGAGIDFAGNLEVLVPLVSALADILPSVTVALLALGTAIAAVKLAQFAASLPAIAANIKIGQLAFIGLAAAITAVDLALKQQTGAGLVDRIFGDVAKMEAAASAAERFANVLYRVEDPAERVAKAIAEIGRVAEEAAPKQSGFENALLGSDNRLFGFNVGLSDGIDKFKEYAAVVEAGAKVMQDNGASATELRNVYAKLSPDLQQVFLDTLGITGATLQSAAAAELGADAVRQWDRDLLSLQPAIEGARGSLEESASPLEDFVAGLKEGSRETKLFDEALNALLKPLASGSLAYIQLNTDIARLDQAIATLENSTGDLSGAQKEQVESLKEQRDELVKQRSEMDNAISVVDEYAAELSALSGKPTSAFYDLTTAVLSSGRAASDVDKIYGDLTDAIRETDTAEAVRKFQELRGELTIEEWAAVVDVLGPAILERLASGIGEGPARAALIAEFQGLGLNAGDAFALGLQLSIPDAQLAAAELAAAGSSSLANELQIKSPSRVWYEYGVMSAQGYIDGILSQEGPVVQAAVAIVAQAAAAAKRAAVSYTEPSGPAGTLPGYAQDVYDRDFPDDTSRRLFSEGEYTTEIGGQRFNTRFTPDGRGYIQLADGSWQSAGNLDLDFGGTLGANTLEDLIARGVIKSAYSGETYVPRDNMLYALHRGEAVIPAASNPYASFLPAMPQQGGGDTSIVIDLSGATLTGSVQDNEAMLTRVVKEAISDQLGHGAFTYGVRRGG